MLGIFKKRSELEKLQDLHKRLMKEAHKLQSINRSVSDQKYVDAGIILRKIESLQVNS